MNKLIITLFLCLLIIVVKSQKPILLMHGLEYNPLLNVGSYHDWDLYIKLIKQNNPNQIAIALNVDNNLLSNKPMFHQIKDIYQLIQSTINENPIFNDGFHIIAHSQGGLSMRAICETYGLNVENFISLAGVQNGVYGFGFLNNYWFGNFTSSQVTNLLYTKTLQNEISVANWWKSPIENDKYLQDNIFLPIINQELNDTTTTTSEYKSNLLSSINGGFYAFGSPDDGVVEPWCSSLFGFYDENLNLILMNETLIYQNDTFGLKTLDNLNKLHLTQVQGVGHADWLSREDLFNQYVLPLISN